MLPKAFFQRPRRVLHAALAACLLLSTVGLSSAEQASIEQGFTDVGLLPEAVALPEVVLPPEGVELPDVGPHPGGSLLPEGHLLPRDVLPDVGPVLDPGSLVPELVPLPSLSCTPDQNPHSYGPLPTIERVVPDSGGLGFVQLVERGGFAISSAGVVSAYDVNQDCLSEPVHLDGAVAEVASPSAVRPTDGELDYGVGGGFFPAGHHAPTFTVVDDVYSTDVRFLVGSDLDGDHRLDCEESFFASGTTTCPAGADGGWWVVLIGHPDPTTGAFSPATTGTILSGTGGTLGAQHFHLAAVATVTINWAYFNGDWAWVDWGPGWNCDVVVNAPLSQGYVRAECTPTYNGVCQNYHVVTSAVGAFGSTAVVDGGIACGSSSSGYTWASCQTYANGAPCQGYAWTTLPAQPLVCDAIVYDYWYELANFVVECYNDP